MADYRGIGAATLVEVLGGWYYTGVTDVEAHVVAEQITSAVTGGGTALVRTTSRGREVLITQYGKTRVYFESK